MLPDLRITRTRQSRLQEVNFDSLGFGDVFSDHMFSLAFEEGRWQRPEILPYGPITLEPGNATLHYGQTAFEGLKAFRGQDENIRIFRPDMNAKRLQRSCERLCIPPIEEQVFLSAVDALTRLDHAWIPRKRGQALYIRTLIFSTENHLEVRPSSTFRFLIMTGPVRAYFQEGVDAIGLKVEEEYTRSAPGGVGYAKTSGNYAASLYPTEKAMKEGYAQVLWLDGVEHRYVEEVGAMNIFFRMGDEIVTPDLHGTILPGVTRASAITLLKDAGHRVTERRVSIEEVAKSIASGGLQEAFGAGTAAIISPVGRLAYRGEVLTINNNATGRVTQWLYDELTGIQLGEVADRHGWNRVLELDDTYAPVSREGTVV